MTTSAGPPLFSDYRRHLDSSRGLSPATVRNYLADLAPFTEYLALQQLALDGSNASLRKFVERQGPQHVAGEYRSLVRDYVAWLLEQRRLGAGRRSGRLGHQRASVVRCLAALRSFIRYLVSEELMPDAPIWAASSTLMRRFAPKVARRLPDTLTATEAMHLVEARGLQPLARPARPGHSDRQASLRLRDQAILEMLYSSGLRVSEAVGTHVSDLAFESRTVRVVGKGLKTRMVPVGRPALEALRAYLANGRPRLAQSASEDATPEEPLFLNQHGRRLSARAVQDMVRRYALAAGLRDGVHPHTLRHSFATHLLDGGADLRIVQELLGHSTPSATQVYTHVSRAEARRVYLAAHPLARKHTKAERESPA